jgi:hypothetical protein
MTGISSDSRATSRGDDAMRQEEPYTMDLQNHAERRRLEHQHRTARHNQIAWMMYQEDTHRAHGAVGMLVRWLRPRAAASGDQAMPAGGAGE